MVGSDPSTEETLPGSAAMPPSRLVVTWGAHEVEVTEKRPLTVGREETNGIVIKSEKVSRVHARIEYRNGHFSLIDQSSNGTYVTHGGANTKVNKETYVLMGKGTISFGVNPASGQPSLFRYAVEP